MKSSMLLLFLGASLAAQERFDMVVRNDFFAGFAGDRAAMARAMKITEADLAAHPRHAEAMVWHGSGLFFLGGQAARENDLPKAAALSRKGLDEMAAAVALEPDNVAVLIPRGATLLAGSHNIPGEQGRELLRTGLADYEKTYAIQKPYFDTLNGHARGELLFGLGEGCLRLGDTERAREWFQKLAAVTDPENGHLRQAKSFLETGKLDGPLTCVGCHVSK